MKSTGELLCDLLRSSLLAFFRFGGILFLSRINSASSQDMVESKARMRHGNPLSAGWMLDAGCLLCYRVHVE